MNQTNRLKTKTEDIHLVCMIIIFYLPIRVLTKILPTQGQSIQNYFKYKNKNKIRIIEFQRWKCFVI